MKCSHEFRMFGRDFFVSVSASRQLWWVTRQDGGRDIQFAAIKVRHLCEFPDARLLIVVVGGLLLKLGWIA